MPPSPPRRLPLAPVLLLLPLLLAGPAAGGAVAQQGAPRDRAVVSFEDHLFLGERMDAARVEAAPLAVPGQEVVVTLRDLVGWRGEDASDPRIESGHLSFRCEAGGRWVSPPGFALDTTLIDSLELGVDSDLPPDFRIGTYFFLDWTARDGDEQRRGTKEVVLPGRGVDRRVVVDFGSHEAWRGQVVEFAIRPYVHEGARAKVTDLAFRGQFGELAKAGHGWREVLIDFHEQPTLFLTVPGEATWTVDVPAGARLHVDLGVVGPGARARFRLTAADAEVRAVLHDEVVDQAGGWRTRVVSLEPLAGRTVELTLAAAAVDGAPPAVACWSDPALRVRSGAASRRPDVFFYLVDTLRADHLPAYGYDAIATPFVDLLAERSVLFEHCVAQGNWTKASMPSIMTGTYVSRHRVTMGRNEISSRLPTLAEELRAAGYRTASFITNRIAGRSTGLHRGFSTLVDASVTADGSLDAIRTLPRQVLPWIERHREEPLFVYVHTCEPHHPYVPGDGCRLDTGYAGDVDGANFMETADTPEDVAEVVALYDGEIQVMDRSLGRFLTHLQRWGLFDDAVFALSSDHGETFQEHGEWTHGAGLYEHQVHVPLLFRAPGRRALEGTRVDAVVRSIDILPTILEEVGLPVPPTVQGRSLFLRPPADAPLIERGALVEDERERKNQTGFRELALRIGKFKVVRKTPQRGEPALMVYDLEADPLERQPVYQGDPGGMPPDLAAALDFVHAWDWHAGLVDDDPTGATAGPADARDAADLGALGYIDTEPPEPVDATPAPDEGGSPR